MALCAYSLLETIYNRLPRSLIQEKVDKGARGHVKNENRERKTYQDVSGVGDSSDDSGSNHKLFPCLGKVDNVDTFVVAFVDVGLHQVRAVLCADVCLKRKVQSQISSKPTLAAIIRAISCSLVFEYAKF